MEMTPKAFFIFVGLVLGPFLVSADLTLNPEEGVKIELRDGAEGITVNAIRDDREYFVGIIASEFVNVSYKSWATNRMAILNFESATKNAELKVSVAITDDRWTLNLKWTAPNTQRLVDCISLGDEQWFGGPEQKRQYWPVQKLNLTEYSYVTKEDDNSAIVEPYWINSNGTILYVDKEVPLFVDQNNLRPGYLCLIAQVKDPYSIKTRTASTLVYDIVFNKNARVGHEYAIGRYLGKPIGYPDSRMIEHPVWSTWARYLRPINQTIVLNFANEIVANGFNNSQFEIDDLWETCYGSLTVKTETFPNFTQMVRDLKSKGFRVSMWIHPFINEGCEPVYTEAKTKGYLVKNEDGGVYTNWWNSNGTNASYVDFTNPEATSWWIKRLITLKTLLEVDSFKFDAGESSWTPQVSVQSGYSNVHPSHITADYVRAVADFGPMIEVRSGQRTQELPVFVRMVDKDSEWTFENGLPTLVTTLLQMNMNGYPLVLPDMIGGNGYDGRPSKELFIRWLQANTFMPTLQYSFVPWDYDNETVAISKKFTDLHAKYADTIIRSMKRSVADGSPVNPPIWWVDPEDAVALEIWDEYLLGNNILVAPILNEQQTSRDIYLPYGLWIYQEDFEQLHLGPIWLRNFSAPLDTLPYFRLVSSATSLGGLHIWAPIMVLIGYLMN